MRRCPSPTRCSTAARMPGRVVDAEGRGRVVGEAGPMTTAGRPSSSSSAGRGSSTWRSVTKTPSTRPSCGEPAVGGRVAVLGDHQQQRVLALGEHHLEPGDEGGEERVGPEDLGRPGDHEADGERLGDRQRPGPRARGPAQVGGDVQDPLPGVRGEPGPVVQREGDRTLRDAGRAGDVVDGGSGHVRRLNRFRSQVSTITLGRIRVDQTPSLDAGRASGDEPATAQLLRPCSLRSSSRRTGSEAAQRASSLSRGGSGRFFSGNRRVSTAGTRAAFEVLDRSQHHGGRDSSRAASCGVSATARAASSGSPSRHSSRAMDTGGMVMTKSPIGTSSPTTPVPAGRFARRTACSGSCAGSDGTGGEIARSTKMGRGSACAGTAAADGCPGDRVHLPRTRRICAEPRSRRGPSQARGSDDGGPVWPALPRHRAPWGSASGPDG